MIFLCLFMIFLMLRLPDVTVTAARTALRVWSLDVVPSLFPYMVFCRLLSQRLQNRRLRAAPVCAVLGLLGGSPSGASVLSVYANSGRLSRRGTLALCALTGTISPMFLLSTMRAWLTDARLCRLLLLCHLLGACLCALVVWCSPPAGGKRTASKLPALKDENAISASVQSILSVGGCIVFFSVLASGICALIPWADEAMRAALHALLEAAGGMHALCAASLSPRVRAVTLAAASGFSGLSILTQNHLFLRALGISLPMLVGFALLRAMFAGAAMACFAMLLL